MLNTATAYWKGVDYSGSGDWLDGSGNGHDAALVNAPTFSNGVWTLNGTNQCFRVPHSTDLNIGTSPFTVLVVAGTTTRTTHALLSKRFNAAAGSAGLVCYMNVDNMAVELSDGSVEDTHDHTSDYDIDPGHFSGSQAWAFGRDETDLLVARNSVYSVATSDDTTGACDNALDMYIGSLNNVAWWWAGTIEAVAIWVGNSLSEAEIATALGELNTPSNAGGSGGLPGHRAPWIGVGIGV